MTREERRLLAACKAAESRVTPQATTCRHGFPLPVERVSRRFVDADGNVRWAQTWVTNKEATCPDQ